VLDVPVPAGTPVSLILAAANRDPARFPGPDRYDLYRSGPGHLAFGSGAHFCAGKWFARAQIAIMLETLLDALPDLRLAEVPTFRGWEFRAPAAVRIKRG
jgi:cytochrome P450